MLARLDAAFSGQQRFVANASHELRTPLAVSRTLLEVALADPDVSEDLRTQRVHADRGVGLGLSIVRSVTRAHRASVTATTRHGGGLDVTVTLHAR